MNATQLAKDLNSEEPIAQTLGVLLSLAPGRDYATSEDMESDLGLDRANRFSNVLIAVRDYQFRAKDEIVYIEELDVFLPANVEPRYLTLDQMLFGQTWPSRLELADAISRLAKELNG